MKKLLFTLFLLIVFPLMASHIVGGEFELLHISGNLYQLNLILYFDKLNGSVGAKDANVTATIYRKRDNQFMSNVFLPLVSETQVGYTQPACSHGEIVTSKLTYTSTVTLPNNVYNDPQGYYVVWQRCCRNYRITNIYSNPPNAGDPTDPNAAGQTFYLEFPPVVKNGVALYNSSPRLFPPLNDYACPNRPYYVNFAGVDDDNDSLVYTLTTPLNTLSSVAFPPAAPGPYPPVRWRLPYSLTNIINGAPDLRITTDGFLTATPTAQGLYVFAVKVEQFRDRQKIGESRRDFQMLVVDGCQPAQPPQIVGKKLNDASFTYSKTMAVSFDNTVPDGSRCIQVRVSDPDSQSAADNYTENISIRVIPLNFSKKKDISGILPSVTTATLDHGSTKDFTICFPQCPYIDGTYQIGIIAYDDACSLPLTDTLKVAVTVQPPPNTLPYFTSPTPVTAVLNEGGSATWSFEVKDNDQDSMFLSLVTDGFVLNDAGMKFTVQTNQKGLIRGQLHWDAFCNIYDFTKRTGFQVKIIANDMDLCAADNPVAAVYNLSVRLPGVADPLVDTDLTPDPHEHLVPGLVRRIGESLTFNVKGTQADNDFLLLSDITTGFKASDYNITFAPVSGNGAVVSHFQWDIGCTNVDLKKKDTFEFHFVLVDNANKCRLLRTDTVTVQVKIVPSENSKPVTVLQSQTDIPLTNNQLSIELGQPVSISVLGDDPDGFPKDNLTLTLVDVKGNVAPEGYTFTGAKGLGTVASPFTWNPDCSIFHDGVYQNHYVFRFGVTDDHCFNVKGDTVTLELNIKNIDDTGKTFLPTNVITPNGDNCNDYFAVEGIDPVASSTDTGCGGAINPDEQVSLPRDNCTGRFEFIRIYNRWGKQVFESVDRRFRWYALNESAGVYYYLILFGNREFKGVVSVRP
jgi:hypothetical protein